MLAYDNGQMNLYVSYSKGFKSGGFNAPALFPQVELKPEKADSFEVGAKLRLFNNRARLNLSAFRVKSSNIQVATIDTSTGSVVQQNAASAKSYGLEASLDASATEHLSFQMGGAYLHSRYDDFADASVVNLVGGVLVSGREDLMGMPTPNSPTWNGTFSSTYLIPLPSDWKSEVTLLARYTSSYNFSAGAGGDQRYDKQNGFWLVNVTGRITPPNRNLTLSWYVNNLFQKHYYDQINTNANFGSYGLPGLPRTWGGTLTYSF